MKYSSMSSPTTNILDFQLKFTPAAPAAPTATTVAVESATPATPPATSPRAKGPIITLTVISTTHNSEKAQNEAKDPKNSLTNRSVFYMFNIKQKSATIIFNQ